MIDQKKDVEIEEGAKFSASQINKLKSEYSKLQKINPESPAYKKMKAALGKMSKEQLKQIKDAKIKFMQFTASELLRKMDEEEENIQEFFTLGVTKPKLSDIQFHLDHLGSSIRLLSNKDLIRSIEHYFKTIKNLKLDRSGRKVLSFEEVHMDKKTYNKFMKEVEEYLTGTEEDVDEALSPSQRRKMGLRMRIQAKKPAFIMKRKRMMKRAANARTLERRARKAAIKKIVKKYYPKLRGKKTSDLSYAERGKISQIVKNKAKVIDRFAKRMVKDKRKQDVERRKSMNKPKDK